MANPDACDAVLNCESTILAADQALAAAGAAAGQELLYIICPSNGRSVSDSLLGYIGKGDAAREKAFMALQGSLLSAETQKKLSELGRRAGLIGLDADQADPQVWRAEWGAELGADLARDLSPVPTPGADVIGEALKLYQTELRKTSLTVWVALLLVVGRRTPLAEQMVGSMVSAQDVAMAAGSLKVAADRLARAAADAPAAEAGVLKTMAGNVLTIRDEISANAEDYRRAKRFISFYLPQIVETVE